MIIDEESNPWFKGKDVAEVLEYKDIDDAVRKHVDSDHKVKYENISRPGDLPVLLIMKNKQCL